MKFVEAALIDKLSSQSSTEPIKKMETSGVVLVAGATGGVGRKVVDILRNKGFPVRALVSSIHSKELYNFECCFLFLTSIEMLVLFFI